MPSGIDPNLFAALAQSYVGGMRAPAGPEQAGRIATVDVSGTNLQYEAPSSVLARTVPALLYGILPSNTGAQNSAGYTAFLASGDSELVLPRGTYTFASTIVVPDGVSIRGEGRAAVVLQWEAAVTKCLQIISTGGTTISELTIDGTPNRSGTGIDLGGNSSALSATLKNVIVENYSDTGGVGIRIGSSIGIGGDGLLIQGCETGILLDGQETGNYPTTNRFGGEIRYCTTSVMVWRGTLNCLRDMVIQANTNGVIMNPRGELPAFTIDHCWFEVNINGDFDIDLRGVNILLRSSIVGTWDSVGTLGGYRRRGFNVAAGDGSVDLTISASTLLGWPLYIPPCDTVTLMQSVSGVGPIMNYGTLNAPVGPSGWAAYFDADTGVTGATPITAWASSQGAAGAISAPVNANLVTNFGGIAGRKGVQFTGGSYLEVSGLDLARWGGTNAPFQVAIEFALMIPHTTGTDALFCMYDAAGNFAVLLLEYTADGAYIDTIRSVSGGTAYRQHVTPITTFGVPLYLAIDFDGQNNLRLSNETGVIDNVIGNIAHAFTPTHIRFGAALTWGGQAGMCIRRAAIQQNIFGSPGIQSLYGHYYQSGWSINDSRNRLEFWKALTLLPV